MSQVDLQPNVVIKKINGIRTKYQFFILAVLVGSTSIFMLLYAVALKILIIKDRQNGIYVVGVSALVGFSKK